MNFDKIIELEATLESSVKELAAKKDEKDKAWKGLTELISGICKKYTFSFKTDRFELKDSVIHIDGTPHKNAPKTSLMEEVKEAFEQALEEQIEALKEIEL